MTSAGQTPLPPRAGAGRRWILACLLILAIMLTGRQVLAGAGAGQALEWVRQEGWMGGILFVLLYGVACVGLVPGSLLTLGAGGVFGPWWGTVWVSIGATTGAMLSFLVGRFLAREWVARRIEKNPRFAAIDAAVGREGWRVVLLLRLSPVVPFNLLNYALGLTRVGWKEYLLASWVGMLPGTVLYVYLGSVIGLAAASERAGEGRVQTPAERLFFWIGLVVTAASAVYITRIARRSLARRLDAPRQGPEA